MSDRIALDLEGVLADTHVPVVTYSEMLDEEHFEGWDFDGEELDEFLSTLEYVWEQRWRDIPPSETALSGKVDDLRSEYPVDLVTNSPGSEQHIKMWLDYYNIEVDDFVFNGHGNYKEELDYDIYIDDNPYLVGEVPRLYFVDTPWNDHLGEDEMGDVVYYDLSAGWSAVHESISSDKPTVVRVDSLGQVYADIVDRRTADSVAI